MWQALILIWNKEQKRQNEQNNPDGQGKPGEQRTVLVQDPDDTGD